MRFCLAASWHRPVWLRLPALQHSPPCSLIPPSPAPTPCPCACPPARLPAEGQGEAEETGARIPARQPHRRRAGLVLELRIPQRAGLCISGPHGQGAGAGLVQWGAWLSGRGDGQPPEAAQCSPNTPAVVLATPSIGPTLCVLLAVACDPCAVLASSQYVRKLQEPCAACRLPALNLCAMCCQGATADARSRRLGVWPCSPLGTPPPQRNTQTQPKRQSPLLINKAHTQMPAGVGRGAAHCGAHLHAPHGQGPGCGVEPSGDARAADGGL